MYPFLFGVRFLPMYGVMIVLGAITAFLIGVFKKRRVPVANLDVFLAGLFALVFGLVGAKILAVIEYMPLLIDGTVSPLQLLRSGFVFYGGLIGGIAGIAIYCRIYRIRFSFMCDAIVPVLPLAHAFGRIGCLCAGCCFGKPTDGSWGIVFSAPLDPTVPVGVPLIPTQLLEAGVLVLIFLILTALSYRKTPSGTLAAVYALLYGVARFVLEFFRDDPDRGNVGLLSTSQFVSVFLVLFAVIVFTKAMWYPKWKQFSARLKKQKRA